jgi:hypothetical protein
LPPNEIPSVEQQVTPPVNPPLAPPLAPPITPPDNTQPLLPPPAANQVPVAVAQIGSGGSKYRVVNSGDSYSGGRNVVLEGKYSVDPDGDKLTYQWSQISGSPIVLSFEKDNIQESQRSLAIPTLGTTDRVTDFEFELKVNDGKATNYDRVKLTICPPHISPSIGGEKYFADISEGKCDYSRIDVRATYALTEKVPEFLKSHLFIIYTDEDGGEFFYRGVLKNFP